MSQNPPTDPAARVLELERQLAEQQAKTNARIIQAELRAEAIRAGMIDLDGLKLADHALVRLSEAGEPQGVAEAVRALRQAKPYLFPQPNSSHPGAAPPAQPPVAKAAMQMSHEEWQAARAALLRHR
jgi:hypothetical protein